MGKYRIRTGQHYNLDKNAKPGTLPTYHRARRKGDPADYRGDLIDTDQDLLQENAPGYPARFERLDGIPGFAAPDLGPDLAKSNAKLERALSRMSVEQLRKYAEDEEIDLGEAGTKEEILEAIRGVAV